MVIFFRRMTSAKEDQNAGVMHSGQYIREKMQLKGLRNKDVAEKTGVSEAMVSKWIHDNGFPDAQHLKTLAEVLDVAPDEIRQGHDQTPEEKSRLYDRVQELENQNASLKQKIQELNADHQKASCEIEKLKEKGTDTGDTVNMILGVIMIVMGIVFLPQMNAEGYALTAWILIIAFFLGIVVFVYGTIQFFRHSFPGRKK